MRIAVVGSGISGLTAAYLLSKKHEVTVFEASESLGGHTATKSVKHNGREYLIDTGFIVFNDWTYPNFIKLLKELGVGSQPTEMGFSVFTRDGNFFYAGNNLNSLFAKRRLLFSASHWRLLKDILRFNRESVKQWQNNEIEEHLTLGEYLKNNNYGASFCDHYLVPMGAAIWSSSTKSMRDFPVKFFIEFFHNHGLLSVFNRPVWRVIKGGSKQYIEPLIQPFKQRLNLAEPVLGVVRGEATVELKTSKGSYEFDHVVCATHSDQALKMLHDPSEQEQQLLGDIKYQPNSVILHLDQTWLPPHKRAWASWNYCLNSSATSPPVLTYNMNILQGLDADETFCVTLNAKGKIEPTKILGEFEYAHPVFDLKAINAQQQWQAINTDLTSFCGAYWFNGFHEDGVNSAIRVANKFGIGL